VDVQRLQQARHHVVGRDGPQAFIEGQIETWAQVVKANKIKAE